MIKREDLNKHLTNSVVIRIDYVPILAEKVDKINEKIAEKFLIGKEKIFQKVKESFVRAIDIKVNDPSIQDFNDFINVNETSKIKSYEYYKIIDNSINIKLIFNRQFTAIEIDQKVLYNSFEKYKKIFLNILEILNGNDIIINRFGFRKFNDLFLKEEADIYNYVKKIYFNFDCDELVGESVENYISEKRFSFKKDFWNINLITHTSRGILEGIDTKRIAFDIDIFMNNIEELQKLFDSSHNGEFIELANNKIFQVYQNLLEEGLISILKKDSTEIDENIIYGVDLNGED